MRWLVRTCAKANKGGRRLKTYPTEVVMSLTTGSLLCDSFGDMHELAEHVYGGPIWTHEFASEKIWKTLQERVFAQHQQLRDFDVKDVKDKNTAEIAAARAIAQFGVSMEIAAGEDARTEGPLETLQKIAPGKPVIVVRTED